jgi:hypothetical protein
VSSGGRWPVSSSQAESCFSKTFMSSNTWLAGILTRDTTRAGIMMSCRLASMSSLGYGGRRRSSTTRAQGEAIANMSAASQQHIGPVTLA